MTRIIAMVKGFANSVTTKGFANAREAGLALPAKNVSDRSVNESRLFTGALTKT
jgi:hypothetical protein